MGSETGRLAKTLCLGLVFIWCGPALAAGEQTYHDQRYGYTISYPAGYLLKNSKSGGYFTLFHEGRRVIAAGVEGLDETGKKELERSPDRWREFLLNRAIHSCDADGPDGSVYCTGIAKEQVWQSAGGLRVMELYLRRVEERFGPPAQRRTDTVGPIYAVDISRPGHVFGLLIGSGHDFPGTLEDRQLVRKIVESIHLLPDEEFQPPQPLKAGPGPLFEGAPGEEKKSNQ